MGWTDLGRAQDGVITRRQWLGTGAALATLKSQVMRDRLTRVADGVYLVGGAPLTFRARLWVATLSTDGVLGFDTAARLWGVTGGEDDPIHVVLAHSRRVYPPTWVRVHRIAVDRVVERADGLRVTSRPWTVMDLVPTLPRGLRGQLADRAFQRGWLTIDDVRRRLRDHPGRTGNGCWRVLIQYAEDNAAARSERLLHRILRSVGLRGWVANYEIWSNGTLVAVADVAVPDCRLVVEVDGWAFHSDAERFQRDRSRQNDLVILGWTVLRFTWADLTGRPGYVAAVVARAAA